MSLLYAIVFRGGGAVWRIKAKLFSQAGIVVLVQGAAMANIVFMPEGASVIELKQYGEYCTQLRDIASVSHLHHFAVRSSSPPQKDEFFNSSEPGCAAVKLPPGHSVGAPAAFCPSMSYNSNWPVTVEMVKFRVAAEEAFAATGMAAMKCECEATSTTGADWWTHVSRR